MSRLPGQGSLFERLTSDLPRRARTQQALAAERVRAIRSHVEELLNARRGGSQGCPDLGLSDMNDAAVGQLELSTHICREIQEMVARYEPRVRVMEVRPLAAVEQPLGLCLRLCCQVLHKDASEQVEMDLLVHHRQQHIHVI